MTEGLDHLAQCDLQLAHVVDVDVGIAEQRAVPVGEVGEERELVVVVELAQEAESGPANREGVRRNSVAGEDAVVRLDVSVRGKEEAPVRALHEEVRAIPTKYLLLGDVGRRRRRFSWRGESSGGYEQEGKQGAEVRPWHLSPLGESTEKPRASECATTPVARMSRPCCPLVSARFKYRPGRSLS